jgi:hypothetical protein
VIREVYGDAFIAKTKKVFSIQFFKIYFFHAAPLS